MLRQAKVYNRHPKPMWKSRTMWFSLSLVIIGSIYDNFSYLQNVINPKYYGTLLILIGIICAVLRFITIQPMKR
jgi:hypothetical protein